MFVPTNSIIHLQGAIVNLFSGLVLIDQCHAKCDAVSRRLKASGLFADVTDYGWGETSKRLIKGSWMRQMWKTKKNLMIWWQFLQTAQLSQGRIRGSLKQEATFYKTASNIKSIIGKPSICFHHIIFCLSHTWKHFLINKLIQLFVRSLQSVEH